MLWYKIQLICSMDHLVLKWTANFSDIAIYCNNITIFEIWINILGCIWLWKVCENQAYYWYWNLVPRPISTLCSPDIKHEISRDLVYCFHPSKRSSSIL